MKIKFINLNLWGVGGIFDKALDFLVKEKFDIICLQEVFDGQAEKLEPGFRALSLLKEKLDLHYHFYSPAFTDNRKEGRIVQGNAIFSKWPIFGSHTAFFDRPYQEDYAEIEENYPFVPRNVQQAVIKKDNVTLNIFNTQGIWGKNGYDNERRIKFSQLVVDLVEDKENVILSGDFNVNEGTKSINILEEHLNNIFKDDKRQSSFNLKRKTNPGYATAVVDFIFASPSIKVVSHKMPSVDVSDHLPLIAELEIR